MPRSHTGRSMFRLRKRPRGVLQSLGVLLLCCAAGLAICYSEASSAARSFAASYTGRHARRLRLQAAGVHGKGAGCAIALGAGGEHTDASSNDEQHQHSEAALSLESTIESGAGVPATVCLISVALGLCAVLVGKSTSAAVLGVLAAVLALVASWAAGFATGKTQSRQMLEVEELAITNQKEWAEFVEEEQEKGSEEEKVLLIDIPRRRKRDAALDAIRTAVFGTTVVSVKHDSVAHGSHAAPPAASPSTLVENKSSLDELPEENKSSLDELPDAPGMAEANLVVSVSCEPQSVEPVSKRAGVARLMERSCGEILQAMAQDGWKVEPLDPAEGIYRMSLPSVTVEFPAGSVSIPSPEFECRVRDSFRSSGDEEERLVGDLLLQNGKDILTVQISFPFPTKLSVSAAGVARARIGRLGDAVFMEVDVKIGLQVPKVPGLTKIMQLFVKNYANKSTLDCATALSKGADKVEVGVEAVERTNMAVAAAAAAVAAAQLEIDVTEVVNLVRMSNEVM